MIRTSIAAFAALAIAGAAQAAPVTYDITTTNSYFGTVSGTVTGEGSKLLSWDVTAHDGESYSFSSAISGQTGLFFASGYTLQDSTPVDSIRLVDGPSFLTSDSFTVVLTGDFTTGLTYVGGQNTYFDGKNLGTFFQATVFNQHSMSQVVADVAFAREAPAPVPEPASLVLLGSGAIGLARLRRR